jgi:hypothetical protein
MISQQINLTFWDLNQRLMTAWDHPKGPIVDGGWHDGQRLQSTTLSHGLYQFGCTGLNHRAIDLQDPFVDLKMLSFRGDQTIDPRL